MQCKSLSLASNYFFNRLPRRKIQRPDQNLAIGAWEKQRNVRIEDDALFCQWGPWLISGQMTFFSYLEHSAIGDEIENECPKICQPDSEKKEIKNDATHYATHPPTGYDWPFPLSKDSFFFLPHWTHLSKKSLSPITFLLRPRLWDNLWSGFIWWRLLGSTSVWFSLE